ncbi:hypothetical protein ACC795_12275 [Rhizobium ruizarguesonis]
MPLTAATVYRDYVTDGIPSSGNNKVRKAEIRILLTGYESIITAFTSNGGLIYSTKAAIDADLAHAAPAMAWVIGDATVANNGVYGKVGASGTGSWTRRSDLPFSFIIGSDAGAGTPNAIQATTAIPVSGSALVVTNVFEANVGSPVTISFNGGTALTIKSNSGNDIVSGGLTAGMLLFGFVSGATFRLISDQASAAIVAAAEAAASAAAGSASAASASAAAAAASAAGVALPAVAANRMLVDNAAGTVRESKTLSETMTILAGAVSGRTSTFSLDNNTLYKARSLKDRWLDSYRLNEELNFTGGGATATDAAVLQALFNRAKAAGRGEVILPRGDIALEATALLKNFTGTNKIRVVGQGAGCTRFLNTSAAQIMFGIGADADADYTRGITLEGFSLATGVAQNDSGRGFDLHHTSDISFKDIFIDGLRNGWSFGVGASATNNSIYSHIHNCGADSPGTSGVAMLRLGSGGILSIGGSAHRWNANGGHTFLEHDDSTYNWDGLYVSHQFFEHWLKYAYSHGKGIVNAEWTGGQMDRASIFFQLQPDVGVAGDNVNWNIHDTQLLAFGTAGHGDYGLLTAHGASGGNINNVRFIGNIVKGLTNKAVFTTSGDSVKVMANQFVNCGNSGTAVLQMDQPPSNGVVSVTGNDIYIGNNPAGSNYTYGIDWIGSTNARRKSFGNNVVAGSSGAENGTA